MPMPPRHPAALEVADPRSHAHGQRLRRHSSGTENSGRPVKVIRARFKDPPGLREGRLRGNLMGKCRLLGSDCHQW